MALILPKQADFVAQSLTLRQFLDVIFPNPRGIVTLVRMKDGPNGKKWFIDRALGPWIDGEEPGQLYFCLSTCEPANPRSRKPSRKKPLLMYAVALDDVGTKVSFDNLPPLSPTWVIETSAGNFQVGYRFTNPTDRGAALLQGMANGGYTDAAAVGAARIMRVPGSINTRKGNWAARMHVWNREVSYTLSELALAFDVTPTDMPAQRSHWPTPLADGETDHVAEWLMNHRGQEGAASGDLIGGVKIPVLCPRRENHTTGDGRTNDSSTVWMIGAPGRFDCKHEHCIKEGFNSDRYLDWMKSRYDDFPLTGIAYTVEKLHETVGKTVSPGTQAALQAAEAVRLEQEEAHNEAVGERARLPQCILRAGYQPVILDATLQILPTLDTPPFRQGGKLVYVTTTRLLPLIDPETQARTEHRVLGVERVTANWLLTEIPRKMIFLKYASRKAEECGRAAPADMPAWLPKAILETHRTIGWAPELLGVVGTPTMRPDGSLLTAPGYDAGTCFFLSGDLPVKLPAAPTRDDAIAALKIIHGELLGEFAFVSDTDRAVAIAGMMTIVLRPAFPHAPGVLINAPARGSGKSYLHDLMALVGTGRPAAVSIWKANGEENDKRLDAMMLSQTPLIGFGNVNGTAVGGDTLNEIITGDSYRPRILGKSEAPEVSTLGTTVIINGNRLSAQEDASDRFLRIDLDTNLDNPRDRNYRGRPAETVRRDRARYVGALLTIARAYVIAGRPGAEDWSSFGAWSKLVRCALCWLDLPDIRQTTRDAAEQDPDRLAVERTLAIVEAHMGVGTKFTAGEFVARMGGSADVVEMHGLLKCDPRADLAAAVGMAFRSRVMDRTVMIGEQDVAGRAFRRRKLVSAGISRGRPHWFLKAF